MIEGTGIDLVPVARFGAFQRRHGARGLARLFTPAEIAYCQTLVGQTQSLAARFAAKEAFFKALGTGYGRGIAWTDLEVVRLPTGQPELRLLGAAGAEAERRGIRRVHLSLTHTEDTAAAFVLLES